MKVYLEIRNDEGETLIEPKWYPANRAAELLSRLIPELHGPSLPVIGADVFSQPYGQSAVFPLSKD